MKIAVINEISAADKNADILRALEDRGHEILNLGNTSGGETPGLLYIHTSFMAALLLNFRVVDFVVGGCGTGLGFLNAVLQYPGVSCGHILTPLDAFLFARINAGNCVSLALNQGYGWAGDVNLRMVFDQLFTSETGSGYPPHRAEPQRQGRDLLARVSLATHKTMPEIISVLPEEIVQSVVQFPAFRAALEKEIRVNPSFKKSLARFI